MKYQHNEPTLHSNKQNVAVVFSIPLYAVTRRRLTILSLFKHYVHTIFHPSRTFSFIRSRGTVLIILCIIFFFLLVYFFRGKKWCDQISTQHSNLVMFALRTLMRIFTTTNKYSTWLIIIVCIVLFIQIRSIMNGTIWRKNIVRL